MALLTACSGRALGSQEDLTEQLDKLELSASFSQLGELYEEECPGNCPSFVRWYDTTAAPETIQAEVRASFEAADIEVNEASESAQLYAARNEEHILFVVLDTTRSRSSSFPRTDFSPE